MAATLSWEGPVGPGNFPDDALLFERMDEGGVYLRVKIYDGGRTVAYAGQSVSLLARFDQHLAAMLSLAAPLRDASGAVVYRGDAGSRLAAYGSLREAASLAAEDAARVRFYYAMCDSYFHLEHLNLVEGLLQRRLIERLADVENAKEAPGAIPDNCPDTWENDFSALGADGRDLLESLLGDTPLRLLTTDSDAV